MRKLAAIISCCVLFGACKVIKVSGDDFVRTIRESKTEMRTAVRPGTTDRYQYKSNGITSFRGTPVNNRSEALVKRKDGKNFTLYFDTIIIEGDSLKGFEYRYDLQYSAINLNDILNVKVTVTPLSRNYSPYY